jgi:hypothetical protein
MAEKGKFKGSDAQKYRSAGARGPGPGAIGRAKIRAAKDIASKSKGFENEGTIYGLRNEGSRLLGQDYGRKIGDVGEPGYYAMGGEVGGCRGGGAALRGTKFRGVK